MDGNGASVQDALPPAHPNVWTLARVWALQDHRRSNKDPVMPLSADQSIFLKNWLRRPIRTGAIAPAHNEAGKGPAQNGHHLG